MENSATPRESPIFRRMLKIFDYMNELAELVDPSIYFKFGFPQSMTEARIWRGHTADIATKLNEKRHVIDRAITSLTILESIRKVARGSHSTPSVYLIGTRPSQLAFEALKERSLLTGRVEIRTQGQQAQDAVNRLNNRVRELEQRVERLEYVQKGYAVPDSSRRV